MVIYAMQIVLKYVQKQRSVTVLRKQIVKHFNLNNFFGAIKCFVFFNTGHFIFLVQKYLAGLFTKKIE